MGKSRTGKGNKKNDSTIIAAIITVSGTIIVALITVFGPNLLKSPQSLPSLTNTLLPTKTLTATSIVSPTEISTSTPTLTPSPIPKIYSEITPKWWDTKNGSDEEYKESKTIIDGILHWQLTTNVTYRFNLRSYLPTAVNFDLETTLTVEEVPYQIEYGIFLDSQNLHIMSF